MSTQHTTTQHSQLNRRQFNRTSTQQTVNSTDCQFNRLSIQQTVNSTDCQFNRPSIQHETIEHTPTNYWLGGLHNRSQQRVDEPTRLKRVAKTFLTRWSTLKTRCWQDKKTVKTAFLRKRVENALVNALKTLANVYNAVFCLQCLQTQNCCTFGQLPTCSLSFEPIGAVVVSIFDMSSILFRERK